MDYTKLGPFKIKRRLSPVTFELELPKDSRIYSVFHVALLETVPQHIPIQTTLQTQEKREYKVKGVLDSRSSIKGYKYLIFWKGYPSEENL